MSDQRFFNADGSISDVTYEDGQMIVSRTQRVDQIIDEFREDTARGHNKRAHGQLAARVPTDLHYQWVREWRDNYADKMTQSAYLIMKVNSAEYSYLRNQKL